MRTRSAAGVSALVLAVGLGGVEAHAQKAGPASLPPYSGYMSPTPTPSRYANGLQRVAYQTVPTPPAVPAPPAVPSATIPPVPAPPSANLPTVPTPPAVAPEATLPPNVPPGTEVPSAPPGPGATGGETGTNTDLSLPKAEREGGGGEPTEAAAAEDEKAEKDPTKLLMNFLGTDEAPVKVYGWFQNSFTGNANGTPKNRINFGVNPNYLANSWQGNQYYLIIENPLEQGDKINFGFRVDNLFGNDWQFNHSHGFLDTVAPLNHFNGYDMAQMYGEVHIPPVLSKGGTDIKGGRFYTILGYEVVPATGRPLLSVPYMFNYGQPFTHFGMLATTHVTDRINWYNGAVNGWDRWINENYKYSYIGGVNWTSKNGKANLALSYIFGPDQFPRFLPTNTVVVPTGYSPVGYLPGRVNPGYAGNWRTTFTTVFTYKWSDTFTQVLETDESIEKNVPGFGPGGTPNDAEWYSFGNWFLWQAIKKDDRDYVTAVWRSEVFRDNNGIRTGFADNFYEMTLGLIIKPTPYLWIRPEARYDWAQFTHPYNDGTRNSQLTLAVDAILLY